MQPRRLARYSIVAVYLLALVYLAARATTSLPISGLELFYTSSQLPNPSYLYYSDSSVREYTADHVMRSEPVNVRGKLWSESFTLPGYRPERWVRIDLDSTARRAYLNGLTLHTRLPLLGRVPVLDLQAQDLFQDIQHARDLYIINKQTWLLIHKTGSRPRFSYLIDEERVNRAIDTPRKVLIFTFHFLLLLLPSCLALYVVLNTRRLISRANACLHDVRSRLTAGAGFGLNRHDDRTRLTITVLVAVALVNAVRLWPNIAVPGLYHEDSHEYFSHLNATASPFDWWLYTQHGYSSLVTILAGWCFTFFPYGLQPYLYTVFAFTLALAPIAVLAHSGFFSSRWFTLFAAIVISVVGYNHLFYYTTLAYGIYTSVILLLLIAIVARPQGPAAVGAYLAIMSLLIWSGPYSVTLLPMSLLLLVYQRDDRYKRYLLMLVMLETVIWFLAMRSGEAGAHPVLSTDALTAYFEHLARDVIFLGLFERDYLYPLTLLAPFLVLLPFSRDRDFVKLGSVLVLVIYTSHALFFVTDKYLQYGAPKPGHLVIPVLFWVLLCMMATERLYQRLRRDRLVTATLVAAIAGITVSVNLSDPAHYHHPTNRDVPLYLDTAEKLTEIMSQHPNAFVVLQMRSMDQRLSLKIGSSSADARQLGSADIEIGSGRKFILNPHPERWRIPESDAAG